MRHETKILHSHYRAACTTVHKTHDKNGKVIGRTRARLPGADSMKEWARHSEEGQAWLRRKTRRGAGR